MRADRAIEEHLTRLQQSGASRPTHRQRAWALNQALTAAALFRIHGDVPTPEQVAGTDPDLLAARIPQVQATELVDTAFTAWFLPWAATGALAATPDAGRSTASARARVVALRALSTELGQGDVEHTHDVPQLRPPTPVTSRVLAAAIHLIAAGPAPSPGRARLGALLAVMLNYPARPFELCRLTIDDVRRDAGSQHLELNCPEDGWIRLPQPQSRLLDRWLVVRQQLVDALLGSAPPQLWVAVRAHNADGHVRPAGLPLLPRGLERTYVTHVRSLNLDLASGFRGPLPAGRGGAPASHLPLSMELLRRSIEAADPA
jgi:integrase